MDSKLEKNLFNAVVNGNYEEAELLLTLGADPNKLLDEGISSFHVAVGLKQDNHLRFTQLFIEHGANTNVKSIDDWTPLHVCACWNRVESLRLLLANGGDPSLLDNDCKSPLHLAIECNSLECIDLLKDYYYFITHNTHVSHTDKSVDSHVSHTSDWMSDTTQYDVTSVSSDLSLSIISTTSNKSTNKCPQVQQQQQQQQEHDQQQQQQQQVVNIKDLEALISNIVDMKLKEQSLSSPLASRTLSSTSSDSSKKTPQESGVSPIKDAINYLNDKKYPVHSPKSQTLNKNSNNNSPHYNQKNGTIYGKLKNWLNKVSHLSNDTCISGVNSDFNLTSLSNTNERVIEDKQERLAFKEKTLLIDNIHEDDNYLTANECTNVTLYSWDEYDRKSECEENKEKGGERRIEYDDIKQMTDVELRREIESFGDRPGPIQKQTRNVYEFRLQQLRNADLNVVQLINKEFNEQLKGLSQELVDALNNNDHNNFNFKLFEKLEYEMSKAFDNSPITMREGNLKQSFTYILIDPRVSDNLPARSKYLSDEDTFRTFIASIFYVGKGVRTRPYQHLYDTLKLWKNQSTSCTTNNAQLQKSRKIQHIMNIWKSGFGVVSLHCFQNVIPIEAYTREAAMIDAIGLTHLTNAQKSNYYGCTQVWPLNKKRQLGVLLLKKACNIFISEGERQIKPIDI